jgi:hypothetical protein
MKRVIIAIIGFLSAPAACAYHNFSKEELIEMVGILLQQNTKLKNELKKAKVELNEEHAINRLEKELQKFNRDIDLK